MANALNCLYFEEEKCRSCSWLSKPYTQQLAEKEAELKRLLSPYFLQSTQFFPSYFGQPAAFRNKAKMVVSGSVERPILGIIEHNVPDSAVDLSDCPLYPATFSSLFASLKHFIGRAGLVPYHIERRKGELKYILITESRYNHAIMLRFVLRSETKLPLILREFPALLEKLPPHSVVSLNIQPQHAAVLEGEKEIFLTENKVIEERFNHVPLFVRPQGFFQTNPQVAEALYYTAQQWVKHLPIQQCWDLFCGVGGFGLHCAAAFKAAGKEIALVGIEISPAAIASATRSAQQLGLSQVTFRALDSATFALSSVDQKPDLVIVNPPRRGIGNELSTFLNQLAPPYLLYSSCNAETMARDLAQLTQYRLEKVQLFDMFPHTPHYEALGLLTHQDRN